MQVICPAILANTQERYHEQIKKVAHFAHRIQIDLTDGQFAKSRTISPGDAWWPVGVKADIHLMYQKPHKAIDTILRHKPNMIILHAESDGDFMSLSKRLRSLGVKAGVALLANTSVNMIIPALDTIDHVLIFSGNLGEYGGHANFELLKKVDFLKQHKPNIEIGWDGGITDQNISRLSSGGVDVFDVGSFIQNANDPHRAYQSLERIAEETGTT
jgi:ribulose-phosphate 3-epimerase